MYRILLVDDDAEVLDVNRRFFEKNNFQVEICTDSTSAMLSVRRFKPECILLDVMMPKLNGYQLCRQMRKVTDVPILFLSGKISEEDKIRGFQCGADDYIEKPYSLKEVYFRIVANIRRHQQLLRKKDENIIEVFPLSIHLENHKVFYLQEEIPLTNREYDLLLCLAKCPDKPLTFREIGIYTWGSYGEEDKKTVMVNVSRLRKKIVDYTGRKDLIETVWSKGYRINRK